MSMRDLVAGAAACAVDGPSSSNPLGGLADRILGFKQKQQEGLRELPVARTLHSNDSVDVSQPDSLADLLELHHQKPLDAYRSEFFKSFHSADHGAFPDAWELVNRPALHVQGQPFVSGMEQIHNEDSNNQHQPTFEGSPQGIMSNFLRTFINSNKDGRPFLPMNLPNLFLSPEDKTRIINRSSIMARHIFADKSQNYINSQVNALLHSLNIDNDIQSKSLNRYPELEKIWNESRGTPYYQAPHSVDGWVSEFYQCKPHEKLEPWADSFQQDHGVNGWATEFEQEQNQAASAGMMGNVNNSRKAVIEHSRMLAHALSQSNDPKFQNSKFIQFMSKMSHGEFIVDDNQIRSVRIAGKWADEYQHQQDCGFSSWGDHFLHQDDSCGDAWAREFATEQVHQAPVEDQWVNEFSKLHLQDWGEQFRQQVTEAFSDTTADEWANLFDGYLTEKHQSYKHGSDGASSDYFFSDMNPYIGHPDPLQEGKDLFRNGLLSEAVLALEAKVLRNPDYGEGWRLLGIAHAENDDDEQAIAALLRSHEADPRNLKVLLALGVSHANEMENPSALRYLFQWIQNHKKYGQLVSLDRADYSPLHADVVRLYYEAAKMSPDDVDVLEVLGVLHNLSREYDKAILAFEMALKFKPRDYSLWNKLGATRARSGLCDDAIFAYQQALDLKPNYVRAWVNMGVSFSYKAMFVDAIRYVVRALAMNPKADCNWGFLASLLRSACRYDLLEVCDSRNLDLLEKEFPL